MSSTAGSELVFAGGGRTSALVVHRSRRARRLRLLVDPASGGVRLTLPARAAIAPALAWAESKRDWIETRLAAVPVACPFVAGALLPFRGVPLRIRHDPAGPRTPRVEGGELRLGGAAESVGSRVLRWLKAAARALLEAESRAFASRAGVTIGRVRVGDARTRWGSCTAAGDLAFSWRLILAPDEVRRATVAHEVAHRLHMNHSPAFHAAHRALLGEDPAPARAWLRREGAGLHRYG